MGKADLFDGVIPNLSIRSHHSAASRLHYWNVFWDHLPRDHHQLKTPNPEQSEQGCNLKRQPPTHLPGKQAYSNQSDCLGPTNPTTRIS